MSCAGLPRRSSQRLSLAPRRLRKRSGGGHATAGMHPDSFSRLTSIDDLRIFGGVASVALRSPSQAAEKIGALALSALSPLCGGRCRRQRGAESQAQQCGGTWSDGAGAPLCHFVTSPPAARGERKSGRGDFFSSLLISLSQFGEAFEGGLFEDVELGVHAGFEFGVGFGVLVGSVVGVSGGILAIAGSSGCVSGRGGWGWSGLVGFVLLRL